MTGQVSRMQGQTPNGEMGLVGYVIAAGVLVLLLPLLPFLVPLLLVYRILAGEDRGPDATRGWRS